MAATVICNPWALDQREELTFWCTADGEQQRTQRKWILSPEWGSVRLIREVRTGKGTSADPHGNQGEPEPCQDLDHVLQLCTEINERDHQNNWLYLLYTSTSSSLSPVKNKQNKTPTNNNLANKRPHAGSFQSFQPHPDVLPLWMEFQVSNSTFRNDKQNLVFRVFPFSNFLTVTQIKSLCQLFFKQHRRTKS